MASSLTDLIAALPSEDGWGPPNVTETTLNGVPYAPFSKGDKLGRMADWTTDSKSERGGRQQYNRNYRGMHTPALPRGRWGAGVDADKPGGLRPADLRCRQRARLRRARR